MKSRCPRNIICYFYSLQSGRIMITAPLSTFPAPTASPMGWTTWLRTFHCPWWPTEISKSWNMPPVLLFVLLWSALTSIFTTPIWLSTMYLKTFCCLLSSPLSKIHFVKLSRGLNGLSRAKALSGTASYKGDNPFSLEGNVKEISMNGL